MIINHNIFGTIMSKVAYSKWKLHMNKMNKNYCSIFSYSEVDDALCMKRCHSCNQFGDDIAYNYRNFERFSSGDDIYHLVNNEMCYLCGKMARNSFNLISADLPKNW